MPAAKITHMMRYSEQRIRRRSAAKRVLAQIKFIHWELYRCIEFRAPKRGVGEALELYYQNFWESVDLHLLCTPPPLLALAAMVVLNFLFGDEHFKAVFEGYGAAVASSLRYGKREVQECIGREAFVIARGTGNRRNQLPAEIICYKRVVPG
jgi:hypothetical protein